MLSHETIPSQHRQLQDQIAAQTAAFLSKGGSITHCGKDDSALGGGQLAPAKFDIVGPKGNRLPVKKSKAKKVQ